MNQILIGIIILLVVGYILAGVGAIAYRRRVKELGAEHLARAKQFEARVGELAAALGKLERLLADKQRLLEDAVKQRDEARVKLEREINHAEALGYRLQQVNSARNVAWTRPPKRLPKNEVKRAFAIAPDAPLWVAFNQELDDYLQDQLDQVSLPPGPTMTKDAREHLAGGVEHLRLLHKRLLELHAAAQTVDADLEAEAPGKGDRA